MSPANDDLRTRRINLGRWRKPAPDPKDGAPPPKKPTGRSKKREPSPDTPITVQVDVGGQQGNPTTAKLDGLQQQNSRHASNLPDWLWPPRFSLALGAVGLLFFGVWVVDTVGPIGGGGSGTTKTITTPTTTTTTPTTTTTTPTTTTTTTTPSTTTTTTNTSQPPPRATPVWSHEYTWPYDAGHDLDTRDVPLSQDTGFVIMPTDPYEFALQPNTTVATDQEHVAAWTGSGKPTLADCTTAFSSNGTNVVGLDNLSFGTWICAETQTGLIARLRYDSAVTTVAPTFTFFITVSKPPQ